MPVVLATGAPTASGAIYEDILGVQYEFPDQYKTYIQEGDRFLYYRGRRAPGSGGKPFYIGDGVVGEIRASRNAGQWVAGVSEVTLFSEPVSVKAPDGTYRESGSASRTNFANGVRRVSDSTFDAILAAGSALPGPTVGAHGDPAHASKLERYSVGVVLDLLSAEFGAGLVREMPPGNPGFDIEISTDPTIHVEVKGTVLPDAVFHLSEGQRRHAELLRGRFRLVVVHDVNLYKQTHRVTQTVGPLVASSVRLQPESYAGVLL